VLTKIWKLEFGFIQQLRTN